MPCQHPFSSIQFITESLSETYFPTLPHGTAEHLENYSNSWQSLFPALLDFGGLFVTPVPQRQKLRRSSFKWLSHQLCVRLTDKNVVFIRYKTNVIQCICIYPNLLLAFDALGGTNGNTECGTDTGAWGTLYRSFGI